jgi:large subunit ribosomal protein L3
MNGYAKKIGMTRVFLDGKAVAVTDNTVVQNKTIEKDGYTAVQLAYFPKKTQSSKSRTGHVAKHGAHQDHKDYYITGEFKGVNLTEDATGITIDDIKEGGHIDVQGTTKGRGFAGVVKRHHFKGLPASRGHDHVRSAGSIGSRWPQRVMPGKKMAGHMGAVKVTVKSLKVVGVDADNKLFYVAGSVPGANKGMVRFQVAKNKK